MLTDKKLSNIARGKLIVNRNLLLEMIDSMLYAMGSATSLEEVCKFQNLCMSSAQESWLELLFDILLKPPTGNEEFEDDGWDAMIWMLLHGAAEKFPQTALEVVLRHFPGDSERLRTAVINTLGATGLAEGFSYVDSYFSQFSRLTEPEMMMLIEAYGDIGGERCIERLKESANDLVLQRREEHPDYPLSMYIQISLRRAAAKVIGVND